MRCTRCKLLETKAEEALLALTSYRFGIEFAPEVVQADGNVRNLAWRVCNAKKVLVSLIDITLFASLAILTSMFYRSPTLHFPMGRTAPWNRSTSSIGTYIYKLRLKDTLIRRLRK